MDRCLRFCKDLPLARIAFGRSCRRNGTILKWKSYKSWWLQCLAKCRYFWRRKNDTPNTSQVAKHWYKWTTNKLHFSIFLSNVFNVIQRGSRVLVHNNVQSAKSNATTQIPRFTIIFCCWHMSMITMEIDVRLVTHFYLDYVGTTWHKVFPFPRKCQFCMFVKGVALLLEVTLPKWNSMTRNAVV